MTEKHRYIYGLHAAMAALKTRPTDVECVYTLHGRRDKRLQAIVDLAQQYQITIKRLDRQALSDKVNDTHHQGIVLHTKAKTTLDLPKTEKELFAYLDTVTTPFFLLVLDGVQDPHNLGACLRTADAAGITAVVAPKDKAAAITPVVRKIACGAAESVPFIQVANLARTLAALKQKQIWVYGACGQAQKPLYDIDLGGNIAVVLGAEGMGLRDLTRKQCDDFFHIPMHGCVESLNVSVATGVCLFEAVRQRR